MSKHLLLTAAIALGLAFAAAHDVQAGQTKQHSVSQTKQHSVSKKLKAGGVQSRAQPGDTCLGVSACNDLIVDCIVSGHDFRPIQTNGPNGEPSYGQCVKRTD
jgi:hypothetical protein